MSYTKGPWKQDKYGTIVSPNGETVRVKGVALSMYRDEEAIANTRLISAAPELLEALQNALIALENSKPIMEHYPEPNMRHIRAYYGAEAAIKKALGE
jgi:hypothetical protein